MCFDEGCVSGFRDHSEEVMDALVRFRCWSEDREKWFEAAGGEKQFSAWARAALKEASSRKKVARHQKTVYEARAVLLPEPPKPAHHHPDSIINQICERTNWPVEKCLCPNCKVKRGL